MGENTWAHIISMAIPGLMILGFWIDMRRGNEQRRVEYIKKLERLETMIQPMWNWFNNGRSKR